MFGIELGLLLPFCLSGFISLSGVETKSGWICILHWWPCCLWHCFQCLTPMGSQGLTLGGYGWLPGFPSVMKLRAGTHCSPPLHTWFVTCMPPARLGPGTADLGINSGYKDKASWNSPSLKYCNYSVWVHCRKLSQLIGHDILIDVCNAYSGTEL